MTEKFEAFKFPTYEEIAKINQVFIDRGEYKGYAINIPVNSLGLYMLIDCQNESVLHVGKDHKPIGEDCIRFAWCNKAGFAVASKKYINTEVGYLAGCAFLVNAANDMMKCFELFLDTNAEDIQTRINDYEERIIEQAKKTVEENQKQYDDMINHYMNNDI